MFNRPSPIVDHQLPISRRVAVSVWGIIVAADLAALYFFASHHLSNLYGDGIAHVDGARRIFDSLTPGLSSIGTVWLPLFHLLAAPLAVNDTLWRTGLAGSLVSATAFALASWFVFRLTRAMNLNLAAGALGLSVFLLNLNLLYLASTPMTELLAIFWNVLIVYCLFLFQQSGKISHLAASGAAAFCGTLTRYGTWYLLPFAALFVLLCRRQDWKTRLEHALLFSLIAGAGPFLWLLHNALRYHNPFAFYNGPGSAKAIYAHQIATTGFHYPTAGSLWLSAHYYVEDMRLVLGPWSLMLAALGLVLWIMEGEVRRRSAALLLFFPLPFYVQGMAFSSVALYVPTLFPWTYYNLRYGLEMAPAVAVFSSFLLSPTLTSRTRRFAFGALVLILVGQIALAARFGMREIPTVREAILNNPCKSPAEQDVIRFLRNHYDGGTVVLAAGQWPCVMPAIDIPFRKTLTQDNRRYWQRLPSGASQYASWVILERGDAVDQLMHAYPQGFSNFKLVYENPLPRGSYVEIFHLIQGRRSP